MSGVDSVLTANEIVPTGREGDIAHVGDDCGPVDHDSDSYRGGIGDERPIDLVVGCANVRSIRPVVKGLIDSVRAPIKYNALTGGLEAKQVGRPEILGRPDRDPELFGASHDIYGHLKNRSVANCPYAAPPEALALEAGMAVRQ
jgi:hypothetical protein